MAPPSTISLPITGLSWGTQPERFVPRDEYDGVLFIDTAHVPNYR